MFTVIKGALGVVGIVFVVLLVSLGIPHLKLWKAERDYETAVKDYKATVEHSNALEEDFRTRYREYLKTKDVQLRADSASANLELATKELTEAENKFRDYDKMKTESEKKSKRADQLKEIRDRAKERVEHKFNSLAEAFTFWE